MSPLGGVGSEAGDGRWRRRAALRRRLATTVLGSDERIRTQSLFILLTSGLHLAWALTYWLTARRSGMTVDALRLMLVIEAVVILGSYPCVRLGRFRQLPDSALVVPQMLWASASAALGFALAPPLRAPLLQVMCIVQMYGFFSMRPRELATAGGGAVLLLTVALAFGAAGRLPGFDVQKEIYPAGLTIAVLFGITAITMDHSARRGRLRAQRLELDAAVAAVRDLAIRDTLTGLFNRRHMQDLLQQEQARARRTGRPFAVALLDLDHFKRINDDHGHGAGDEVLRDFAELATRSMRQSDTVGRWGGEEFLVLMPDTDAETEARAPLERLRADLGRQEAQSLLQRIGVTFSAGIAFHAGDQSVDQVVACADRALYAAKAAGRDRLSMAVRLVDEQAPFSAPVP